MFQIYETILLILKRKSILRLYSVYQKWFKPFSEFYPDAEQIFLEDRDAKVDGEGVLIVWGGGDIHPVLYDRPNYASHVSDRPSSRDIVEVMMMEKFINNGWPIIGVCRGAQLGCAAAGGLLIQHADGHTRSHQIQTSCGKQVVSSSLHHQMMYPWLVPHELLAWTSPARSKNYHGITDEEATKIPLRDGLYTEPEVVWFNEIKCLAIQGHPEFMEATTLFNIYVKELCHRYINPCLS